MKLLRPLPFLTLFSFLVCFSTNAQSTVWTLHDAVQYALKHNLSIKQSELNSRLAKLTHQQNILSQIPSVNLSTGYGRSFGRSIDPTTNQFVEGSSYDYLSLGGNADVLLFGWFQKRNMIGQGRYNAMAAEKELEQLQNDISLNVATGYLRALLAKEQVNINRQQVGLSQQQLTQTASFAEAGRVPELNVAQLEAQVAGDSANLIAAINEYTLAILDIKALLNLDLNTPFEIEIPDAGAISADFENAHMDPEDIYTTASTSLPSISASMLRYRAAKKAYTAAKGGLLPQLGLSAQAGTNYSTLNRNYNITGVANKPVTGTYAYDSLGGNIYQVYQATPVFTTSTIPLGSQLDNNFRQTVSLGLTIPLFNGWQAQTATRQAKINMLSRELSLQQAELKLKQDVYKAHNDAKNSLQKYFAAQRGAEASKRAYEFAQKRYELGLTNTVEYLVIQNNWSRAEANLASAKYDLVFKLKIIDYYLGNELKL